MELRRKGACIKKSLQQVSDLPLYRAWFHRSPAMAPLETTTITCTLQVFACFVNVGMQCLSNAYFTPSVIRSLWYFSFSFPWCAHLSPLSALRFSLSQATSQNSFWRRITSRKTSCHGQQTSKCLETYPSKHYRPTFKCLEVINDMIPEWSKPLTPKKNYSL